MVNKKGYIKTLEAVIAVIMVVIVGYIVIPRNVETPSDVPLIVKGAQSIIPQNIQFNASVRKLVTAEQLTGYKCCEMLESVEHIINEFIPFGYAYTCAICSNPGTCVAERSPYGKSIYMTDVLVTPSEAGQSPKVVRMWFWKEPTDSAEVPDACKDKCVDISVRTAQSNGCGCQDRAETLCKPPLT